MHVLVGTDSVHTTAAICDYLSERATADDAVTAVSVVPDDDPPARRDAEEAVTVAPVRLPGVGTVETDLRTGDPAPTLLAVADEIDADELVICAHSGHPEAERTAGSTARALLEAATLPVVVAPVPDV